jgi:hypothetical protein
MRLSQMKSSIFSERVVAALPFGLSVGREVDLLAIQRPVEMDLPRQCGGTATRQSRGIWGQKEHPRGLRSTRRTGAVSTIAVTIIVTSKVVVGGRYHQQRGGLPSTGNVRLPGVKGDCRG